MKKKFTILKHFVMDEFYKENKLFYQLRLNGEKKFESPASEGADKFFREATNFIDHYERINPKQKILKTNKVK